MYIYNDLRNPDYAEKDYRPFDERNPSLYNLFQELNLEIPSKGVFCQLFEEYDCFSVGLVGGKHQITVHHENGSAAFHLVLETQNTELVPVFTSSAEDSDLVKTIILNSNIFDNADSHK